MYGVDLMFIHRCDEAIRVFQEVLKVDSVYSFAKGMLEQVYQCAGRQEEALKMRKKNTINPETLKAIDEGYAEGGYQGAYRKLADLTAERAKNRYIKPTVIANLYAAAGDTTKAIDWLEKGYEERDPSMVYLLLPRNDVLRDEPRF